MISPTAKNVINLFLTCVILFSVYRAYQTQFNRREPKSFLSKSSQKAYEEEDRKSKLLSEKFSLVSNWGKPFLSSECSFHRRLPSGTFEQGTVGQGMRAMCDSSLRRTREYTSEIAPSFDVSLSKRAIYLPVMKGGTQMFQEVFRRRFRGTRLTGQNELSKFLAKNDKLISQFFVFSFVRNPFRMFLSSYDEVNKYVMNNRTMNRGFGDVPEDNEPLRAITCLNNVRTGFFKGLVPAHMYTQLWKLQRCDIKLNFVGKLENVVEDWKFVESQLKVAHEKLPLIHAASQSKKPVAASKEVLGEFETDPKFANLTRQVCEYYRSDFDCFGYDSTPCQMV